MNNFKKKAIAFSLVMAGISSVSVVQANSALSSSSASSASSIASQFDDPKCEHTISNIQDEAERRANEAKANQESTTVTAKTFTEAIEGCVSQIGGAFDNPFGRPGNPFDGLSEKLCQKGLDIVTTDNPLTKAINGVSLADPTGTFTYNPKVGLNKSGKFTRTQNVEVNDTANQAWGEIDGGLPNNSEIWN